METGASSEISQWGECLCRTMVWEINPKEPDCGHHRQRSGYES